MNKIYWLIWCKITGNKFWVGQPIIKNGEYSVQIYAEKSVISTMLLPVLKLQNGDIDWERYLKQGYQFYTLSRNLKNLKNTPQEIRDAVVELFTIYYELKEWKPK